jgi:hypothetical protein
MDRGECTYAMRARPEVGWHQRQGSAGAVAMKAILLLGSPKQNGSGDRERHPEMVRATVVAVPALARLTSPQN